MVAAGEAVAPVELFCVFTRALRTALLAGLVGALVPLTSVSARNAAPRAANAKPACPVLVLGAMPLEVDPLLAAAKVSSTPAWVADGKGFWAGTLGGNRVVLAMTGIGMVNATNTTKAAYAHFRCFSAVVFSGTSGGDYIGDVMVPSRWTEDGRHFLATSPALLAVMAEAVRHPVHLLQTTPTGDPTCTCQLTGVSSENTPLTVEHAPKVEVGGTGLSSDGFGGRALPCVDRASDVFGCWPCRYPDSQTAGQTSSLGATVPPFLQTSFFLDYQANSAAPPGKYVSEDNETAAVFSVAAAHRTPYIGFRAASDGGGDPLHLPGFPVEFFVYRQLAADNAASTALAFLTAYHQPR
jgi:nucleoside phosphorylase